MSWYQNIDGIKGAVFKDPNRKNSKYWNEGKWNNFIKPLLPKKRGTFIEIGCNAGLFLKMATNAGFKKVIGIEGSRRRIKQARLFREANGYSYELIQQKVGVNFDLNQLPLADVVLFSNVHYYFPIHEFATLVNRLRNKTRYCIIVSAKTHRWSGKAVHYLESPGVRGYFRDWGEIRVVGDWRGVKDVSEDPAPREQMYGVLFKGGLDVYRLKGWYKKQAEYKGNDLAIIDALREFSIKVLTGDKFDIEKTLFYQYWQKRSPTSSREWRKEKLFYKKSLVEDIQENGIKEPIYLDQRGKLLDGIHRLIIAKELGYKYVLARIL